MSPPGWQAGPPYAAAQPPTSTAAKQPDSTSLAPVVVGVCLVEVVLDECGHVDIPPLPDSALEAADVFVIVHGRVDMAPNCGRALGELLYAAKSITIAASGPVSRITLDVARAAADTRAWHRALRWGAHD